MVTAASLRAPGAVRTFILTTGPAGSERTAPERRVQAEEQHVAPRTDDGQTDGELTGSFRCLVPSDDTPTCSQRSCSSGEICKVSV